LEVTTNCQALVLRKSNEKEALAAEGGKKADDGNGDNESSDESIDESIDEESNDNSDEEE
jgi:hypothetical protein